MEKNAFLKQAGEYYRLVVDFCSYLENTVIGTGNLDALMAYLMQLYVKGVAIPNASPHDCLSFDYEQRHGFLKIDCKSDY